MTTLSMVKEIVGMRHARFVFQKWVFLNTYCDRRRTTAIFNLKLSKYEQILIDLVKLVVHYGPDNSICVFSMVNIFEAV